ncbi:cathepsin B-like [Cimex lectularius]|uniref:Peptidase C1A papain C-terminal domain-containing protein n=1 Tax=Cimex lectularius TaxID=79782 RepID=A0A8I6STH9_CIMLE|nr:cathepsin B-like [Cimex lectularius]
MLSTLQTQPGRMNCLLLFGLLICAVNAKTVGLFNAEAIINEINSANTTWKAGHNFAKDTPLRYIKKLLGVVPSGEPKILLQLNKRVTSDDELPNEFDARKKWPNCPTVSHIHDQGSCGSCWAISTAAVFSDRLCIFSGGKFTLPLSSHNLLTCCTDCGYGCDGGTPFPAWDYFKNNGLVTGGGYNSSVGCQPYEVPECDHYTKGKRPDCATLPDFQTPPCQMTCLNSEYKTNLKNDRHKMKTIYSVSSDVKEIQKELMTNGPVSSMFKIYSDFPYYKSGVYQHISGKYLGNHAVRLLGWGTENGIPYWLVANSWNTNWGDKGLFKILRGQNECKIESSVQGGEPYV